MKLIRIGVVNIDTSHPLSFASYLSKSGRARYAAVYNDGFREDDEVQAFISKNGLEKRCGSVDELLEYSDIGFIQGCNWNLHLQHALPFIKKGKPVFIDKPLAGNLKDCRAFEKLAREGAVILGCSSARYAEEIESFLSQPEEVRGKILGIFGTVGVDEFNYAVHIVEVIGGIAGTGAVSSKFAGSGGTAGKVCDTYFVRFESGITAVYSITAGIWQPFDLTVMTTKTTVHFRIDTSRIYCALLDRICDYMETGNNRLVPVNALTESVKIMLAGRLSRLNNGIEVELSQLSENDPGYDGCKFEKEYAAAAQKLYLQQIML